MILRGEILYVRGTDGRQDGDEHQGAFLAMGAQVDINVKNAVYAFGSGFHGFNYSLPQKWFCVQYGGRIFSG